MTLGPAVTRRSLAAGVLDSRVVSVTPRCSASQDEKGVSHEEICNLCVLTDPRVLWLRPGEATQTNLLLSIPHLLYASVAEGLVYSVSDVR